MSFSKSIFVIILSAILLNGCTALNDQTTDHKSEYRISFGKNIRLREHTMDLIIMDQDGNHMKWIEAASGSYSWSHDGVKIAAGCYDDKSSICIFDASQFYDFTKFPMDETRSERLKVIQKIKIPSRCGDGFQKDDGSKASGIISIAWSPSDDRLAIVCMRFDYYIDSNGNHERDVCVVHLSDVSGNCMQNELSLRASRVSWGPDEDILLLGEYPSENGKIKLIQTDGTLVRELQDGWSPSWSPDGKSIAFISLLPKRKSDRSISFQIGVMDKDGVIKKSIYKSDNEIMGNLLLEDEITRLSWTPRGDYLLFVSASFTLYNYRLFRIDVNTGEISVLLDPRIFTNQIVEPDTVLIKQ